MRTAPKNVRRWCVRFPHDDAVAVARAARRSGVTISTFLRDAALAQAREPTPGRAPPRPKGIYDIP